MDSALSPELKNLVGESLELLGKAIVVEYGQKTFDLIERIRLKYKEARQSNLEETMQEHGEVLEIFEGLNKDVQFKIAHAFAISLEIINSCENAHRSFRIRQSKFESQGAFSERITYVLTAHPTESRSPECIRIFTKLTELFERVFEGERRLLNEDIYHLLVVSLKSSVAREAKPEVIDEADYIYSIALRESILTSLIDNLRDGRTVFLRSWVGGDKDGHPGVDWKVTLRSLEHSRKVLIDHTQRLLTNALEDLELIEASSALRTALKSELKKLQSLRKVKKGDGRSIRALRTAIVRLEARYLKLVHTPSPHFKDLAELLKMFPALVVPLELRENSALIHEAYTKKRGAILEMLKLIAQVAAGGEASWYTRGMIISSTESAADIRVASQLVAWTMKNQYVPVVPLFESRASLEHASEILEEVFQDKKFIDLCHKHWSSRFEVMVGYSDSAKESGSLMSRFLIRESLYKLEKMLESKKLIPIFFHGSGGSVARGGGSLEEQVSWWPLSSRKVFKVTLQGEMVYRSFSTAAIFNKQVQKILSNSKAAKPTNYDAKSSKVLRDFAHRSSEEYRKLIADESFLDVVEKTTPYRYLNELKIGSRPAKRVKSQKTHTLALGSLRAIPWVLCWTQNRSLLTTWWGIGSAWAALPQKDKDSLKETFKTDVFFTSFIKLLAFTLAKVNLSVWFSYLENLSLDPTLAKDFRKKCTKEFDLAVDMIREISGQAELLWFRPWLETSIELRSTMIHPLNMAQIIALRTANAKLLRETVTGIASGMLTTG